MKTLFIPEIGTEIKLAEDWTFTLHAERRNQTLAAAFGYEMNGYNKFSDYQKLVEIRNKIDEARSQIIWPSESSMPSVWLESHETRRRKETEFWKSKLHIGNGHYY